MLQDLWERVFVHEDYEPAIARAVDTVAKQIERAAAQQEAGTADPELEADFVVVLCVTTFKRTFQVKNAFPPSVAATWPHRAKVIWSIVDFNDPEGLGTF